MKSVTRSHTCCVHARWGQINPAGPAAELGSWNTAVPRVCPVTALTTGRLPENVASQTRPELLSQSAGAPVFPLASWGLPGFSH